MILGIDEVGRGAWAGPVVVGAVAIEPEIIQGLNDSKLLSKKKRIFYAKQIREHASWIGIGWVSARKIDEIGISSALKLAAERSILGAPPFISEIIIDGTLRLIESPQVTLLKKADRLIPAVSAASIIAKVARDQYMQSLHGLFPDYCFDAHVGYGTPQHQAALQAHGPSTVHRMSFAPMTATVAEEKLTVKTAGGQAETAAAIYLQAQGFNILARNWKTRRCEIDIIAEKAGTVYCVEVKYRRNARQGEGFAYVTQNKQKQMQFAAEMWKNTEKWTGPIQLAALQVAGEIFSVTGFTTEVPASAARHAGTRQFGS